MKTNTVTVTNYVTEVGISNEVWLQAQQIKWDHIGGIGSMLALAIILTAAFWAMSRQS